MLSAAAAGSKMLDPRTSVMNISDHHHGNVTTIKMKNDVCAKTRRNKVQHHSENENTEEKQDFRNV